jgi:microcystin-dependent protein
MDYFIGTILLLPYSFTPMTMLLCNGQTLNTMAYQALFSLIGNTYGGDGSTTFAVPNMLGQEPQPGMNYYIVYEGIYPTRD